MYKAKFDGDEGVRACKVIDGDPAGYKRVNTYFVDNSGVGTESELALTFENFLKRVKQNLYYAIIGQGQFQVYVGEFEKIKGEKTFNVSSNREVVERWRKGKVGNSKHLHTDGENLFSYRLLIGYTEHDDNLCKKIVKDYTAEHFISQTTSHHVSIAKGYADKVMKV